MPHDLTQLKHLLQNGAEALGIKLYVSGHRRNITIHRGFPKDMDPGFAPIYHQCQPYTMTSLERMYSLYQSIEYIIANNIPGDFVECGVWKGGSTMLIALTLLKHHISNRPIYLYDTFKGMTEPTKEDIRISDNSPAHHTWRHQQHADHNDYAYASLAEVKQNMQLTHYPDSYLVYVEGLVEHPLPASSPQQISLLRLDTDWYKSTYHELVHLYPRLVTNGVLILDDYGHFAGARQAVNEYFSHQARPLLLHRVDYTGRVGIKTT